MNFLEAMQLKPAERLILLPANEAPDAMERERRQRLEVHERFNHKRDLDQFARLEAQSKGA